jgi:hypothetical protein
MKTNVAANPFSTRFIRPGAVPFLFTDGQTPPSLVEPLAAGGWWGQIIGPHGSGKSTLLATLLPELEKAGRKVVSIALRQGERRLPPCIHQGFSPQTQMVIDGYEQLSWWSRWRLQSICRRKCAGLLITAHSDSGLPTIYRTESSEALAQAVVAQVLSGRFTQITAADISAAYRAAGGSTRETLFKLYDVYAEREPLASTLTS